MENTDMMKTDVSMKKVDKGYIISYRKKLPKAGNKNDYSMNEYKYMEEAFSEGAAAMERFMELSGDDSMHKEK